MDLLYLQNGIFSQINKRLNDELSLNDFIIILIELDIELD